MVLSNAARLISEVIAPVQLLETRLADISIESCGACGADDDVM